MDTIALKYGSNVQRGEIPSCHILKPQEVPRTDEPEVLINTALASPIGSQSLAGIVTAGEKVAIVTSDITRYTGSEIYLPLLVAELNQIGVPDSDIEIIIALGIHRYQTEAEQRKIVGSLFGRIAVYDHECDDPAELIDLGRTDGGIRVKINRRVVTADRVIVTGTIGFHYFAGFGGGRKGLVPGVASRETCMASHFAVFNPPEIGGKHPQATIGAMAENPVNHNLVQAARLVKPDFLLNTVLSPQKKIIGVFCGDMEGAHLAGCELVRKIFQVPLSSPADLAIVSCGGEPKDINFIQAQKALDYGSRAVKKGGTIILLAACKDGFGNPIFFDWFRYQDLTEFETALRQDYQINGQTAHATLAKAQRFRVILVSEFTSAQTETMGMEKALDLQVAIDMALATIDSDSKIVVIPDGGMVVPVVEGYNCTPEI